MKTLLGLSKKFVVASVIVASALAFTSCKKDSAPANNKTFSISGSANGNQMVPPVSGSGTGTITGTYNSNTGVLTYTSNWNGLSGSPSSAGFYTGASGTNGTAIGTGWGMGTTLGATGSYSGQMTLTQDQATQLENGNWYYIINTPANANGEIRGQITATPM